MLRQLTIRTRFGSELERVRDQERLIAWMHTIVLPPTALIMLVAFPLTDSRWVFPGILAVTTAVMWIALSRPLTMRGLRVLGWFTIVADTALIVAAMFIADSTPVMVGVFFCGVLVMIEAAARFQIIGGFLSGLSFAVATVAWMEYRHEKLGTPLELNSMLLIVMMFLVIGLVIGVIIHGLERARSSLWRRVRQAELVNRFALEAPRRSESENVAALAELVARDLECDGVWVLLHDPSTARLHVAAVAGSAASVDAFAAGISMAEHDHPAIRAFHSGAGVLVKDPAHADQIGVPLRAGARALGAMLLIVPEEQDYKDDELKLLEVVAGELAQVLENVRLGDVQRETIDELRRLAELKDDFITVASHELRTPLTAMRGFVRALQDVRANPEQSERAVAAIDRQVERMHRLVEDLLAVSMIDSGRSTPMPQSVALADAATKVWYEVDPKDDKHTFALDIADDATMVAADPAFLKRILDNLIANAVEFSPDGGAVTVRARVEGGSDAPMARVEVIDEGVGINPEDLDQLFEKFVRLSSNRRPEGTGLGLYIVRGLARAMGGTTGVASRPGVGSSFSFTIPLIAGAPLARAAEVPAPRADEASSSGPTAP